MLKQATNQPVRIGICEDDSTQLQCLRHEVLQYYDEKGISVNIELFQSAEELLFKYPEDLPFHCLLLDIGLHGMDGMKLARHIHQHDSHLVIIFITGYKEYVFEGYIAGAFRYLLKPYQKCDLWEALSSMGKEKLDCGNKTEDYIGFFYLGDYIKLKKSDIIYAEVKGHYIYIKTKKQEYSYKGSMKKLKEQWNDSCFCMVNRSVLANIQNIDKITKTECFFSCQTSCQVSRGCYKALNQAFVKYYF
ncbi:MAG: response regulator transcription factor [Lachnospiraceae bacterium]|nr:response regulator transcription factor [Lachnospiraceae bacterium]